MDIDPYKDILAPIGVGIIVAVLVSSWVKLSQSGAEFWKNLGESNHLRLVFILTVVALFLSLSAVYIMFAHPRWVWTDSYTAETPEGPWSEAAALDREFPAHPTYRAYIGQSQCPAGTVLTGGFCWIDLATGASGSLEQTGISHSGAPENIFYCIWGNVVHPDKFIGKAQAACTKIVKVSSRLVN